MMVQESEKDIRIAVFPGFFYPHLGGHEKYVEELYARIVSDQIQVDIIVPNTEHGNSEEVYRGLHILRYDCWNALNGTWPIPKINRRFLLLWKKLRQQRYTIVNTHTRFFTNAVIGAWLAQRSQAKHIHTEHGTSHVRLRSRFFSLLAWVYDHTIGWAVIRHANKVTAISHASGHFAGHLGARQWQVFPNSICVEDFPPRTEKPEGKLKLRVAFVGRLIYAKGVQDLLMAWKKIHGEQYGTLHIVGDGPYRATLEHLAQGIPAVVFHGSLSYLQLPGFYRSCDIFVNPSYSEGLPTSLLEAGSSGCVLLATAVGGTQEIFSSVTSQFLFRPGDQDALANKLLDRIQNPQENYAYGHSISKRIGNNFSVSVVAEQFKAYVCQIA